MQKRRLSQNGQDDVLETVKSLRPRLNDQMPQVTVNGPMPEALLNGQVPQTLLAIYELCSHENNGIVSAQHCLPCQSAVFASGSHLM